jgi:hypothetical protein
MTLKITRNKEIYIQALSSEMDPTKIRFIRKAFVSEREARRVVLLKNPPVPHPVRAL